MARLQFFDSGLAEGNNLEFGAASILPYLTVVTATSTVVSGDLRYLGEPTYIITFGGQGFAFDILNSPIAGQITSITESYAGLPYYALTDVDISVRMFNDWLIRNASFTALTTVFAGADSILGTSYDDDLSGYAGDDSIAGGSGFDILYGETGQDRLSGSNGADTLFGGAGDDTLEGGGAIDRLVGADGYDVASYLGAAGAVAASLLSGRGTAGEASGDTLEGIESLLGSRFADTLTGSADHNILEGGAGGDRIDGQAGNDWLSYEGAGGAIAINLESGAGWAGDATSDNVTAVENLRGSRFGDYLYGDWQANILRGDEGGDVLYGAGNSDTIYYSTSPAAVRVDLSSNSATGGHAQGDTLVSVENVFATPYNDTLIGDSASNTMVGWLGVDVLTGNGSNDIFRWSALNESGVAAGTRDVVTDFWRAHGDLLDLSGITPGNGSSAFTFIGTSGFNGAGQIRFFQDGLGNTVVEVNADWSLSADMAIQLSGVITLGAVDFIL